MEWLNGSTLTPTATQRRNQHPIWRFAPFFLGANSEVLPRVSVSTSLSILSADHEVCRLCRLFFAKLQAMLSEAGNNSGWSIGLEVMYHFRLLARLSFRLPPSRRVIAEDMKFHRLVDVMLMARKLP